jgi:DNA excision repair protein ERCC-3
MAHPDNPLVVQSDRTLLLEVHGPRYPAARDALARFAELVKSPEHVHTYRVSPLSLWNAASAGHSAAEIISSLEEFSKYAVPDNVKTDIRDFIGRYGRLVLSRGPDDALVLRAEQVLLREVAGLRAVAPLLGPSVEGGFTIPLLNRGLIKQALLRHGYPVEDRAGFAEGSPFSLALRETTLAGKPLALRPYQKEAVQVFLAGAAGNQAAGGHGVIVLPCGAGKTLVGMAAMAGLQTHTLILVTNITSARQWRDELLDKTTARPEDVGEYHGRTKQVRPITIATYQVITTKRGDAYPHFDLLSRAEFGLIVYDEVHLLPAPIFRITAELQARRRLGLTATLVREDNKEGDVFALIGPKRYDVPWKEMEAQGYVAEASCYELRLPLPEDRRLGYAVAEQRERFRIAAENPDKVIAALELCENHQRDQVLVIGQYLDQLQALATALQAPLITGETPQGRREHLLGEFRRGERSLLVVSKVANFSIDLPEANVCIQVSGSFGSRQEEAQRLGRILRPKASGKQATFYSLVTRDSVEQQFAMNRQLFLTEQGYRYYIEDFVPSRRVEVVSAVSEAAQKALAAPVAALPAVGAAGAVAIEGIEIEAEVAAAEDDGGQAR